MDTFVVLLRVSGQQSLERFDFDTMDEARKFKELQANNMSVVSSQIILRRDYDEACREVMEYTRNPF